MMKTFDMIWLLMLLFGLSGCPSDCYKNGYGSITSYDIDPNRESADGIRVDDQEFELDLEELDRQTRALEECLEVTVNRDCLIVMVPPDWYISPCSGQQIFPCDVNPQVCLDKGIPPEELEICPCSCRATIQYENYIITAPNLLIYRGELARMVLGVNNVWLEPSYSRCLVD